MDTKKIEQGVRFLLEGIGEDLNRDGLKETPHRVSKMLQEVLSSTGLSNAEISQRFNKCFPVDKKNSRGLVVVREIPAFSWCEHHMALMYDMQVTVAYRPVDKVIGLSKIPRIVDAVTKRLQLQERIGEDIAEILQQITGSEDIAVIITAKHSCVTVRGIKSASVTQTVTLRGNLQKQDVI